MNQSSVSNLPPHPEAPPFVDFTSAPVAKSAKRPDATQEIDVADIFEMHEINSAKEAAARKSDAVDASLRPAPRADATDEHAKPLPSFSLPTFEESADVERVVMPVELPTLRNLKAISPQLATLALETLRLPAMSLEQAKSSILKARKPGATVATVVVDDSAITIRKDPSKFLAWKIRSLRVMRTLPTPIWASVSAAVAAMLVGAAALAASSGGPTTNDARDVRDEAPGVDARVSARNEANIALAFQSSALKRAETSARWSDLPPFVADVSVEALPKR